MRVIDKLRCPSTYNCMKCEHEKVQNICEKMHLTAYIFDPRIEKIVRKREQDWKKPEDWFCEDYESY